MSIISLLCRRIAHDFCSKVSLRGMQGRYASSSRSSCVFRDILKGHLYIFYLIHPQPSNHPIYLSSCKCPTSQRMGESSFPEFLYLPNIRRLQVHGHSWYPSRIFHNPDIAQLARRSVESPSSGHYFPQVISLFLDPVTLLNVHAGAQLVALA